QLHVRAAGGTCPLRPGAGALCRPPVLSFSGEGDGVWMAVRDGGVPPIAGSVPVCYYTKRIVSFRILGGHLMILVTGATGKTGRHLTGELGRRGERVRAFVRNPAAAAAALGPEVEIVAGDLDRADTLAAAMSGVDRLYLLAPPSPGLARVEAGALEVARRAGVRRIG